MIKEKYPEELSIQESEKFSYELIDSNGTFGEDYTKAVKWTKRRGGKVYTMVDGDDGEMCYLKGLHYVNRFGICVLKVGDFWEIKKKEKPEYLEMERKQNALNHKLRILRGDVKTQFFITDEGGEVISYGYKTKTLAEKFIPILRFSPKEKLKIIKLECNENGKIKV